MKKTIMNSLLTFILVGILGLALIPSAAIAGSGVYGGGPIYMNRSVTIPELKASGFTHVVVWTIHIESNGDMGFNGEFPLCSNGSYIGNSSYPNFASDMASLKSGTTSVVRVEFGLSGWGSGTFANIRSLIASQGTGPTSILYRNFQALKQAIPAVDALNFDDESEYDVSSSVQFAVMVADLGYKVTLCPYTSSSYWSSVASQTNSQRPGAVDLVMLQCYAGGAGNNPCTWANYFSNIPVWGSCWSGTASSVLSTMTNWNNQCGMPGGFMWLYDEWVNNGMAAQYANAINTAVGGSAPGAASNPNPSNGATSVSTSVTLSWTAGSGATSRDVYFGTDSTPDSGELQGNQTATSFNPGTLSTGTTYYWRIDEKNSYGTTTGTVWHFTTGSTTDVDHTDPPGTGTITARAEINSTEGRARAFDNLYSAGTQNVNWSKWLDNGGVPSTSNPSWIQIQLPSSVVVNKLAIVSANDDYGRDPENFALKGSSNGSTWTTLGSWTSQTFSNRFERKEFTFSNSTSYSYYRLEITKNDDDVSMTQLCEIELIGPQGSSPTLPGLATNPSPSNGATSVSTSATLSWTAGSDATSHDVYFGTDSSPDSGELQGNQTGTTFNPGTLANSTTYYWRIDEKNSAGTTTGTVWSFTTSSGSGGSYASIPYSTGFESGTFDSYWTTVTENSYGRILITSANTPRGSYHMTMDVNSNGHYCTNEARLGVNLSGQTNVELKFWWKEFGDEDHTEDGVFFSANGGSSFTKVYSLTGGSSSYQEITLDVDQLASANGLSLTSTFVIKFQQRDNYAISTDGFAFDDISVSPGSSGTDITDSGGTISAQYTDSPSGEDIAKLIDNTSSTKYLTFHASGWVQFHANTGAVVVKYTITSANDAAERDPKNWTLQGSNNGSTWTTLDTQTNQSFASRFLTKTYTFSNSTSYTYYRLNVTAVQSGSILQMSEWELWTGSLSKGMAENNNELQSLPKVFALEQNYPNPFNPTTTLRYQLPEAGEVTLKVYDVLGREVASLFNGYSPAGSYTTVWNAGHLSSGVYYCRLRMVQTDGKLLTQTKSMLLLK